MRDLINEYTQTDNQAKERIIRHTIPSELKKEIYEKGVNNISNNVLEKYF